MHKLKQDCLFILISCRLFCKDFCWIPRSASNAMMQETPSNFRNRTIQLTSATEVQTDPMLPLLRLKISQPWLCYLVTSIRQLLNSKHIIYFHKFSTAKFSSGKTDDSSPLQVLHSCVHSGVTVLWKKYKNLKELRKARKTVTCLREGNVMITKRLVAIR